MSSPEDRRLSRRLSLILQVEYPDREGFVADSTENLCAGGAFVRTERPLATGDRVPLMLSFPGLLDPLDVIGVVTRVRLKRGDEPAGVGIMIPEDRPADRRKLQELMDRIHRQASASATSPQAPNELGPSPAPPAPPGAAAPASGFRVLIVEDNPHLLDMYQYVIHKMASTELGGKVPFEVVSAADGHQAWLKLAAERFDLVVTDMYMPVMDGFALVERIRSDERMRTMPVVAISAGDAQAAARARAVGVSTYLRKPVRFVEVLETVRTLLNLRST